MNALEAIHGLALVPLGWYAALAASLALGAWALFWLMVGRRCFACWPAPGAERPFAKTEDGRMMMSCASCGSLYLAN